MRNYALRGTPSLILIDREGRDREQLFCRKPDLALGATIKDLVLDRTPSANDLVSQKSSDDHQDDVCVV